MPHYQVEFEFCDREREVQRTTIMVESPDDNTVIADIGRWMKRRHHCVPEWFDTFYAVAIYGYVIGRVDEKGSLDPGIRHRAYEWKFDRGPYGYGRLPEEGKPK